ncbi:hypothetical protein Tco_0835263 [Tanacetum coccineum]
MKQLKKGNLIRLKFLSKKRGDDEDQDPPTDTNKEKKMRRRKDVEPSKQSSTFKESPKGKTPPKNSKTRKSMNAEETVEEPVPKVAMDVEESILDDVTWFNDLVNAEKDSLTFDDLMATPIDFTKFAMNCLKKDKITKADLIGHVYKLLKGTCRSSIELEYNMEQCYLALVKVDKQFGYGYLEEIVVRRADPKEYTFKEGDFPRLHMNDIKDMLLLHVQNKLFNLPGNDIVDLVIPLRMFTRSLVIKKRVEDVQLGVESYQKKLNITKPQTTFDGILYKEPYTTTYDPKGVVYLNKSK